MANRELVKTYIAEGNISPHRIVKFGSADYGVLQAAAATDKLVGVTVPLVSAVSGDSVDVIHEGIADIELGGTVTRGDLITADANGKGVVSAPAAGSNNRVIGSANVSGVAGDIIPVLISLASVQG